MFDINRAKVRKNLYAAIEWFNKALASVSAAIAALTVLMTQLGDLGVDFPAELVTGIGIATAVVTAVMGWAAKVSKDRVVEEIDGVLVYFDSTPE